MLTYLVAFVLAAAVAAGLTPLVVAWAKKLQLLDQPDSIRKLHGRAVPRLGGVAVVTAFLVPVVALALHDNDVAAAVYADWRLALAFIGGALAIVALGVYDDLRSTDARKKLIVQALVASAMWLAGFRVEHVGGSLGFSMALGALSFPITVAWIVGVVNAVNLIDGLDGLASGIALAATVVLLGVALFQDQVLLALLMVALAGALVGFLIFNFNPAKIFLGDSGSLFLGFVLAVASLWTHQKANAAAAVTLLPLFALAVPLLDTTLCIVRRAARGQHPFTPDREHLHHRLMALGLSHRNAVLALWGVAAVFGAAALMLLDQHPVRRGVAIVLALAVGAYLVKRVGLFGETPWASKRLLVRARSVASQVRTAPSYEHAWRELQSVLPTLGCDEAYVEVNDEKQAGRQLSWKNGNERADRRRKRSVLRLPLGRRERVGELEVLWSERPVTAPMHAARKKALRSLHVALSDVQARERRAALDPASEPALWGARTQTAGRAVLD